MSYDLFFLGSHTQTSSAEFIRYFAERANFSIKNGQARYQNEDTGVYFSFELVQGSDETPGYWVQFNINYCRPRFFALEALPQVESFASRFGLSVHDPQIDGMGDGRFDPEGFIRGWQVGNEAACSALAESGLPRPQTMAADQLNATWQWNMGRRELQARIGESVFVPKVIFVTGPLSGLRATVWADAIPILLPTVNIVFLYRDAYAPRRLFRRKPDLARVHWDQVEPVVREYQEQSGPLPYRRVEYISVPMAISTLFRQAPASVPGSVVDADSVLESELVAQIPQWQAAG